MILGENGRTEQVEGTQTGADLLLDGPPRDEDVGKTIRLNSKRAALIGVGALVVLALGAWGAIAMLGNADKGDGGVDSGEQVRPGETPGAADDTETADADEPGGDSSTTPTGTAVDDDETPYPVLDVGKVAFRMQASLWIAAGDGSDAKAVTSSTAGPFALSPDGEMLAMVEGGKLFIAAAKDGARVEVGASTEEFAWLADSSALMYVAPVSPLAKEVRRVPRNGKGATKVADAGGPVATGPILGAYAYFANGSIANPPFSMGLVEGAGARPQTLKLSNRITDLALATDAFYYVALGDGAVSTIRCGTADDPDGRQVMGPPTQPGRVNHGSLMVSPDGKSLAYATYGDDGYSRLFAVRTDGSRVRELSIRRDAYPLRWTADGQYILFIEGNAIQGEATRLMRVKPDGTGRSTLIEGAGVY